MRSLRYRKSLYLLCLHIPVRPPADKRRMCVCVLGAGLQLLAMTSSPPHRRRGRGMQPNANEMSFCVSSTSLSLLSPSQWGGGRAVIDRPIIRRRMLQCINKLRLFPQSPAPGRMMDSTSCSSNNAPAGEVRGS